MKRQRRTGWRHGSRLSAQVFVIAVIAAMLLTTLPFSNQADAFQGNDAEPTATETVDTTDPNGQGEQPDVVDETPTEEETPIEEPTVIPDGEEEQNEDSEQNQSLAPPGSSSITINKHVCYGTVSGDIYEMAASCDPADQVYTFNLFYGIPQIGTSNTSGNLAGFSGLSTGTYGVEEAPSAGTNGVLVYCKVSDYLGNTVQPLAHYPDWYGRIEVNIATDGDMVYCDWFNLKDAKQPVAGASITINKHVCFGEVSGDIYEMAASCDPADQVYTFNLRYGIPTIATAQTDGNIAGFEGLQPGVYYVGEEQTADTKGVLVYCKIDDFIGNPIQELTHYPDWYGEIEINIAAENSMVHCDWFNLKDAPATDTDSGASITINKHVCYGPVSGDIYEMAESCDPADQVYTYNLYTGLAQIGTAQTEGTFAGFGSLQPGVYNVEEIPSADTTGALVYCKIDDFIGNPVQELAHYEDFDWRIEVQITAEGQMVYCDWFNLKDAQPTTDANPDADPDATPDSDPDADADAPEGAGTVIINKLTCPADFNAYNADFFSIAENCKEAVGPVEFYLTDADENQTVRQTSATAPYIATWNNAPAGQFSIAEDLPDGYDTPRVFCHNETDAGESDAQMEMSVIGASITAEVKVEYDILYCDWVNIPVGKVEILINKHLCPAGFYSTTLQELSDKCDETYNPITFSLYGALVGDTGSQTTGDVMQGGVHFIDLYADRWTVTETLPAGYGAPVVFCKVMPKYVGLDTAGYEQAPVINGRAIQYDIAAGYVLTCEWYNIQAEYEDGAITIIKHTCYPGYDVNAYGANPWLDCPELTNGVTFTLYHPTDGPLQTTTGDIIDGGVYWGGLEPDTYRVQETYPANTWYAFLYGCQSSENEKMLAPTNLFTVDGTGSVYIVLEPGQHLTCHWYNVPYPHDGGTMVITKYWCDGTVYSIYACDIYEQGASFDISNPSTGVRVTTGANGSVSVDLGAGTYNLDEVGFKWCHAEASTTDSQGGIVVEEGKTTYVSVFNCGPRQTPQPQGKPQPGKFPNTGLGPMIHAQPVA